jgi:electron transport protein HydN
MNSKDSCFVLAEAEKCSGCRACEIACFAAHAASCKAEKPKTVGNVTAPVIPNLYLTRIEQICMPVQCHHCEEAPCIKSCLTGAMERIEGTVVINRKKCIGCKNCVMACPFGAVQITVGPAGLPNAAPVNKCDLCIDTKSPACVEACPNKALRLVNVEEEISEKRQHSAEAMDAILNASKQQTVVQEGRC